MNRQKLWLAGIPNSDAKPLADAGKATPTDTALTMDTPKAVE